MKIEMIKDVVDYGVIGLLAFLGFVVISYTIERIIFYRGINTKDYNHKLKLELDLSKRLSTIATIGSNAPYIGLLGTVLAIIITFYIIGDKQGSIEIGEIMKSLALALKATAVGLIVAIPSTVSYNMLLDRVDRLLIEWEINNDEA